MPNAGVRPAPILRIGGCHRGPMLEPHRMRSTDPSPSTTAVSPEPGVAAAAQALWQLELENPMMRLMCGLPVTHMPAGTFDEAARDAGRARSIAASVADIDLQRLSETDRLTVEVLRHRVAQATDEPVNWMRLSPVAPYSSMGLGYIAQRLLAPLAIDSAEDFERWQSLWSDFGALLRQVRVRTLAQAATGWRLAQPAIDPTLASWRQQQQMLIALLTPSEARAACVAPELQTRWRDTLSRVRDNEIAPALQAIIDALDDSTYRAAAPERVGLMHLPGGTDEYRRLIALHLTEPGDPQRIHEIGLAEVQRIGERMQEVRSRIGFAGTEREFHAALKRDPRVIASSPEDVAARYQRCMERLAPQLSSWFSQMPQSPHAVERLAPELEAGMTYGYYDRPARIGEPGTYRFNASNLQERSQLQVAALIYHELAPGHHFHLARQMEMAHLPAFRRNAMQYTIYNEGWAEYASGLAGEMGLYEDPYDLYGRLVHERFVAQRLVVDTGMNALGWTLDQAREFMRANTLEGEAQVASETLRYSTDLPAQSLAYRLGNLEMLALREAARERRGAAFDIRKFHEAVLGEGAMPMPTLRGHLERVLPR